MKGVLLKLVVVAAIAMACVMSADSAITCSAVQSALVQCVPFIAGNAPRPTAPCCNGVKGLNGAARTTPDRQAACNCIKNSARAIGLNYGKAAKLPGLCGVKIGIPISASVNCASIR
eukprot:Gb_41630 [translate_table: standard]